MKPLWPDDVEQRIRKEATNLDPQKTPDEIVMCKRCVVTNQRPRIVFDEEGVCSACRYAEHKKTIDWSAREKELREVLHYKSGSWGGVCKRRGRVVVPASGGKDSAFVASWLRDTYFMNVLAARWAPFMTTEIGERNWQGFCHSGFDTVTAQTNGLLHRKLARLAFEFYGDPFQPFVYGQLCWPMHVAAQNGIKLVFFGENGEAEYGGDPSANDRPCWNDEDWERVYTKGASVRDLVKLGQDLGAISAEEMQGISRYYGMPRFAGWKPEFHWLGYYLPWHPQHNYYHAAEHMGFEANEERSEGTYSKYASIDDKLDGLHYYMAYVKFGIGRCTSDAAHEVRDGDLERDEALALVKQYDGEFPTRHLDECLDYLGMDRRNLAKVMERFSPTGVKRELALRDLDARFQAHSAA